jgi:NAD(P)-dependent dehydrogenase (short-subunit alcohol dehydrogenase family)
MTFSGKVAFITGGGSGMGHLAARNLAARGPLVAALHVNTSGLAQTAAGYDNINFASMAGWMPILYLGAYNASKFAVVAFSEVLYHQNRNRGVRFACVCPPPVSTPLLKQAKRRSGRSSSTSSSLKPFSMTSSRRSTKTNSGSFPAVARRCAGACVAGLPV